jgi:hypothetical protein
MTMRPLAITVCLALAASACKDSTSVTDLNNVSAEALAAGLNRSSTGLLATGLMNQSRAELDARYLIFSETLARDFYRLDNAENRFITETIGGPSDNTGFVGAGVFTQFYVTVRAANTILNLLPKATGLTSAETRATAGLARTLAAQSLYRALTLRDSIGIAIDVNHPIDSLPAPFVCKPTALASISATLDSAAADLAAGGAAFPFAMPAGYSSNGDFSTPATFLRYNRALKGKVELYRALDHARPSAGSFATAITALNAAIGSAAPPAASDLQNGVYDTFSTAASETTNPIADANIYLNPSVGDSIQPGDLRASKITPVPSKSLFGVTTTYKTNRTDPAGLQNPIPVFKVTEMTLLRAQAKIGLGDLVGATADINAVRTGAGGLAPIVVPATAADAISAVLYEKRYSLLAEGAQRLVDLRAYSRLNATYLKKELPGDVFQSALPIPKRELDARGVTSVTLLCP